MVWEKDSATLKNKNALGTKRVLEKTECYEKRTVLPKKISRML